MVERRIPANNPWHKFETSWQTPSYVLLPFLKHWSYFFSKCSDPLNVWMTFHHRWIKGGTVKDSTVPGTSSQSDSCLRMLLIPRNDVTLESSNQSHWWIYKMGQARVSDYLPSVLTVPASSSSLSPTRVFSLTLIRSICTVLSLAVSGGLSLMLKGFWQRSRLMCVSLLIDSSH